MILTLDMNTTVTVNENDPALFTCSTAGLPPPYISWYRNGSILDNTTNNRVILGDPSQPEGYNFTDSGDVLGTIYRVTRNLTLDTTEDQDSGVYSCVADNGNAREPNVSRDFELIVQRKSTSTA